MTWMSHLDILVRHSHVDGGSLALALLRSAGLALHKLGRLRTLLDAMPFGGEWRRRHCFLQLQKLSINTWTAHTMITKAW